MFRPVPAPASRINRAPDVRRQTSGRTFRYRSISHGKSRRSYQPAIRAYFFRRGSAFTSGAGWPAARFPVFDHDRQNAENDDHEHGILQIPLDPGNAAEMVTQRGHHQPPADPAENVEGKKPPILHLRHARDRKSTRLNSSHS